MAAIRIMRERRAVSRSETALFLAGLSGIAAIFLPFTWDTSPWAVTGHSVYRAIAGSSHVEFDLLLVGCPFLLAISISAAWLLLLIGRPPPRPIWISAYILALASAGGILYLLAGLVSKDAPSDPREWAALISPLAILFAGAVMVTRNSRFRLPHALNAIIAMQAAYLAGAALPLVLFSPGWRIGAYLTLVTVVVYVFHIAVVTPRRALDD